MILGGLVTNKYAFTLQSLYQPTTGHYRQTQPLGLIARTFMGGRTSAVDRPTLRHVSNLHIKANVFFSTNQSKTRS